MSVTNGDPYFQDVADVVTCESEATGLIDGDPFFTGAPTEEKPTDSDDIALGDPFFTGNGVGEACRTESDQVDSNDDDTFPNFGKPNGYGEVFRTIVDKVYVLRERNGVKGLALVKKFDQSINSAGISSKTGNLWVVENTGVDKSIIEVDSQTYATLSFYDIPVTTHTYSGFIVPSYDYLYMNGSEGYFNIIDLADGSYVGRLTFEVNVTIADWTFDTVTMKAWSIAQGDLISIDLSDGSMNFYPIQFPSGVTDIFIGAFSDANGDGFFVDQNGRMFRLNIADYERDGIAPHTELFVYGDEVNSEDGAADPTKLNILSRT